MQVAMLWTNSGGKGDERMLMEIGWQQFIQSGMSAGSGLVGVLVGGWLVGKHQKQERQNARRSQQCMEFYAPLRAMWAEVRAKTQLRLKVHATAQALWPEKFQGVEDPGVKISIDQQQTPKYEEILDYSNEQLEKDIIPLYRKMLGHFSAHMGLAEQSTLEHYAAFVEFVEIWNRYLRGSLPLEVANKLNHSEASLYPLYEDIQQNFNRLRTELRA
jgi:hypothetical protein